MDYSSQQRECKTVFFFKNSECSEALLGSLRGVRGRARLERCALRSEIERFGPRRTPLRSTLLHERRFFYYSVLNGIKVRVILPECSEKLGVPTGGVRGECGRVRAVRYASFSK